MCGISRGLLGGRSALVYSLQLNKLRVSGTQCPSILRRGGGSLNHVEVLSRPITHVAISMRVETRENRTLQAPLRPPSLLNKTKEKALC